MALNGTTTAADIVTAIIAQRTSLGATTSAAEQTEMTNFWTAIINALYTRIKADMKVTIGIDAGQAVATTGTALAQTGATTNTWVGDTSKTGGSVV